MLRTPSENFSTPERLPGRPNVLSELGTYLELPHFPLLRNLPFLLLRRFEVSRFLHKLHLASQNIVSGGYNSIRKLLKQEMGRPSKDAENVALPNEYRRVILLTQFSRNESSCGLSQSTITIRGGEKL